MDKFSGHVLCLCIPKTLSSSLYGVLTVPACSAIILVCRRMIKQPLAATVHLFPHGTVNIAMVLKASLLLPFDPCHHHYSTLTSFMLTCLRQRRHTVECPLMCHAVQRVRVCVYVCVFEYICIPMYVRCSKPTEVEYCHER